MAADAAAKAAADEEARVAAEAAAKAKAEEWWHGTDQCPVGGEHCWSNYRGRQGSGRACSNCYETRDSSNQPVWWCASRALRDRIAGGGCPAGGTHTLVPYSGNRGSGACCDKCGFTKDANGKVLLLPQLLGAFGPQYQ